MRALFVFPDLRREARRYMVRAPLVYPDSGRGARKNTMKSFSLTKRIIAIVVTCQLLLAIGLILVAVIYGRSELKGAFDATLEGKAMSALALLQYTEPKPHVLLFDATLLPPPSDPAHQDQYAIWSSDGQLIARSSGWESVPPALAQGDQRYADFTLAGAPYRAVSLRNVSVLDKEGVEDNGKSPAKVTLIYASSLVGNHLRLTQLAALVGATSILLLLVTSAFAVWSVRRGLAPLRELAAQANTLSVRNWNFSAPPGDSLATELSPFVHAIEAVLARLKESFRQQRDFTNDAAHELKTSVAIVKSTLQSLLHRPRTQQEYETELEQLLEDCARLEDLLGRMLRLARIEQLAENGVPPKHATTELTSPCAAERRRYGGGVRGGFRTWYPSRGTAPHLRAISSRRSFARALHRRLRLGSGNLQSPRGRIQRHNRSRESPRPGDPNASAIARRIKLTGTSRREPQLK